MQELSSKIPLEVNCRVPCLVCSIFGEVLQNIIQNHEEEPSSSFLKQDEMTGFWYKMTSEQVIGHTIRTVTLKNNPFLSLMDQEISFLQAEVQYQFPCRNTGPLRHITLQYLSYWRDVLFGSSLRLPTNTTTLDSIITNHNTPQSSQLFYSVRSKSTVKTYLSFMTNTRIVPLLKNYNPYKNYNHYEELDDGSEFLIPFELNDIVECNQTIY